jgi:hypothetical protein
MQRRYKEDIQAAGGDTTKPPRSVIILRADKETPFVRAPGSDEPGVYEIMKACQEAGYPKAQLRAIRFGGQVQ